MSTSALILSRNLPCPCVYMGMWWCCGDVLSRICQMKSLLMQKCLSASALPIPEISRLKRNVLMMFFFLHRLVPLTTARECLSQKSRAVLPHTLRMAVRDERQRDLCCLVQGKGSLLGLFPHTLNMQLLETKGECPPMIP